MTPDFKPQTGQTCRPDGLVTTNMNSQAAQFWAPLRLQEIERERPGEPLTRGEDLIRSRFIVEVRRTTWNEYAEDGQLTGKAVHAWTLEIEHEGAIWRIPGLVWERADQYRERIEAEARYNSSREALVARDCMVRRDRPAPVSRETDAQASDESGDTARGNEISADGAGAPNFWHTGSSNQLLRRRRGIG